MVSIHKRGLMTSGCSTDNSGQKRLFKVRTTYICLCQSHVSVLGLYRIRELPMAQLQDLNKSKLRSKVDENLIGEISRLESTIAVTRDDLVSVSCYHHNMHSCIQTRVCRQICISKTADDSDCKIS